MENHRLDVATDTVNFSLELKFYVTGILIESDVYLHNGFPPVFVFTFMNYVVILHSIISRSMHTRNILPLCRN